MVEFNFKKIMLNKLLKIAVRLWRVTFCWFILYPVFLNKQYQSYICSSMKKEKKRERATEKKTDKE
jgi:hypothetical protein